MKINLYCIGKTDDEYFRKMILGYEKKLPKFISYNRIEIPGVKLGKKVNKNILLEKEAALFLKNIEKTGLNVLLDEEGEHFTSLNWAKYFQRKMNNATQTINFLIGGPYGFHESIYKLANEKIALSKMTFTHQMVRLFFAEQLYRAFSIIQNKEYHHE